MLGHAMAKLASENTNVYRYKQLDVYMEHAGTSMYFIFIKYVFQTTHSVTFPCHQQDFEKSDSVRTESLCYPAATGILYWELA